MSVHNYTIKVEQNKGGMGGTEGRVGTLSEPNNANFPKITVQTPGEFNGPAARDGTSIDWTPEDLYIGSVAVCLFTTFVKIAENSHLNYSSFEVEATGKMVEDDDLGKWMSEIHQRALVKVSEEKHVRKARRIVEKAEENCLIAKSMKTKISISVNVKIQ